MTRNELEKRIIKAYGAKPEMLFREYPEFSVFRHSDNRKWFAVVMTVSPSKFGLSGSDSMDIVNLKCDPVLIPNVIMESGCFPAYHMNKNHWVSVALDGTASDDRLRFLLDMSYELTTKRRK